MLRNVKLSYSFDLSLKLINLGTSQNGSYSSLTADEIRCLFSAKQTKFVYLDMLTNANLWRTLYKRYSNFEHHKYRANYSEISESLKKEQHNKLQFLQTIKWWLPNLESHFKRVGYYKSLQFFSQDQRAGLCICNRKFSMFFGACLFFAGLSLNSRILRKSYLVKLKVC